MNQLIYKNGCWDCKKARENPQQNYICPKFKEHWQEWQEYIKEKKENE